MENKTILYQFPLSLYCEKTRWNLDFKKIQYQCQDLLPGTHIFIAWRLAQQRSLPILTDRKKTIGDSTNIAIYLEKQYQQFPLIPTNQVLAKKVLELEDWFDELGDHVRRYCWSEAVNHPDVVDIFFNFQGYSQLQKMISHYNAPLLRLMIKRTFKVYDIQVENSWNHINDALKKIEIWLGGNPESYLVNNTFTLADLTAASMLAPMIGPENSPWSDTRLPEIDYQKQKMLQESIVGQWVLRLYREYR